MLALKFLNGRNRTILSEVQHRGPLRVQRPFYPGDGSCHVYLLHPPGGCVGGDTLAMDIVAGAGASALLTTPAAGKFYRCAAPELAQGQAVTLHAEAGALLEWLPQETLVFDGAQPRMSTSISLDETAAFIGWDILCFGRPAAGQTFEHGRLRQSLAVYRGGRLALHERLALDAGSPAMTAAWGLAGQTVCATFVAVMPDPADPGAALREALPDSAAPCWGITFKQGIALVRYLGPSAAQCRRGFDAARALLLERCLGLAKSRPRIWNT
ncbi:MAG: urease accessory protein UreD [Gammaproteobacteria bacterium]|nr:urease accessory protein UreD [Gammaproteobacteria bacterium]